MLFLLFSTIVLSVSVLSADNNEWTMEIPNKVIGREGNSLVLFCSFTHPFHEYKGNISIIWKNGKRDVTFLNYTNYPSKDGFENHIYHNRESRCQILGDPRKNSASIIIKQLRKKDHEKAFLCQIDFTEEPKGKFEDADRTIKVTVEDAGESSVIVKRGDSAAFPCYFTPPVKNSISISVIWMKGDLPNVSIVFNTTRSSSASLHYTNTVNEGGRYELVGDPEQGNASIRVTDLRLNDISTYFCHVWFKDKKNKITVIQDEMQIYVPATILSLSPVTDDIGDALECRAEGNPPANITWNDLENSAVPMNSSEMTVTGGLQSAGKLVLPRLRGSYRCVAMNEHGTDTREIHLAKTETSALILALFIVLASLVIISSVVSVVWSLKKGSCQHGRRADSSVVSGVRSRTAEPDLQLETDPIYSFVNSTAETILQVATTPGRNDPHESPNQHLYSNVNFQTDSQTEMNPHDSPSYCLYSNVQLLTPRCTETASIYATTVHSDEQSSDLHND